MKNIDLSNCLLFLYLFIKFKSEIIPKSFLKLRMKKLTTGSSRDMS